MRLICPNCGAQYEVPQEVIPEAGRDVQCSSCGHTWFQAHPDHDPGLAEDLGQPVPEQDWDEGAPEPGPEPEPAPGGEPEDQAPEVQQETPHEPPTDAAPAPQPRRRLDPAVADLLREEAEAEARARAAEQQRAGLESQPELGLDQDTRMSDEAQRAREARDRLARMQGRDPEAEAAVQAADGEAAPPGSRRDLLPDIDEINSTLRSGEERKANGADLPDWPEEGEPQRSGFRRGFVLAVAIFAIATLLYVYAPAITAKLPEAGPVLSPYVAWVDGLRDWLNDELVGLLVWLETIAESSGD